ncbi:MAG: zinc-ribbon domain-containing protein, partial [Nitrososphaera sp.]|nr:zinc-ribbon domain-containing protein [Nitrososphaera sp.]
YVVTQELPKYLVLHRNVRPAPSERLKRDSGCPYCAGRKVSRSNCLGATHPNVASEWNYSKNGDLTPFDLVAGSVKKVWWKCLHGHEWKISPGNRTSGAMTNCPTCRMSKGEKTIANYLDCRHVLNVPQWGQKREGLPKGYAFDFAVDRSGHFWLIEYHGEQHYVPVGFGSSRKEAKYEIYANAIRRDEVKKKWCNEHQKQLLVIPYWDFDRITIILNEFFAGKVPNISEPPELVQQFEPNRQAVLKQLGFS